VCLVLVTEANHADNGAGLQFPAKEDADRSDRHAVCVAIRPDGGPIRRPAVVPWPCRSQRNRCPIVSLSPPPHLNLCSILLFSLTDLKKSLTANG
jgi:hypothetical protein